MIILNQEPFILANESNEKILSEFRKMSSWGYAAINIKARAKASALQMDFELDGSTNTVLFSDIEELATELNTRFSRAKSEVVLEGFEPHIKFRLLPKFVLVYLAIQQTGSSSWNNFVDIDLNSYNKGIIMVNDKVYRFTQEEVACDTESNIIVPDKGEREDNQLSD